MRAIIIVIAVPISLLLVNELRAQNVGVGTAVPSAKLQIQQSANVTGLLVKVSDASAADTAISIITESTAADQFGLSIVVEGTGTGTKTGIETLVDLNTNSTGISFGTDARINLNGTNGSVMGTRNHLVGPGTAAGPYYYGTYNQLDVSGGNLVGTYNYLNTSSNSDYVWGTYNRLFGSGTGEHVGMLNNMQGMGNNAQHGTKTSFSGTGSGGKYAVSNSFGLGAEGEQYGMHNVNLSNSNSDQWGVYNEFTGTGTGAKTGVENLFNSTGGFPRRGMLTQFMGAGGAAVGTQTIVWSSATDANAKYGHSVTIDPAAGGTHYGIFSDVQSATGYAGYFRGNVGIGTALGNEYTMPASRGTNLQVMQTDGSGNVSWVDPSSLGGNTLDQAYDEGGAGIGRTINATNGVVSIQGTDGFEIRGTYGAGATIPPIGSGARFYFNPRKVVFRAGYAGGGGVWEDANVGDLSIGLGENVRATGYGSVAIGGALYSTNYRSLALGYDNDATGIYSTVMGFRNDASGHRSTAMGYETEAYSYGETAIGIGPTTYTPSVDGDSLFRAANATDRLFVVGNAIDANGNNVVDASERSNALVVLKNGNTTLKGELTLTDGTGSYTLPNVDGTSNQVLQTDGSGTVSWANVSSSAWQTAGNAGTNPTTNFVGTTDAQDLVFRTSNAENMRININGNVGLGTTTNSARLYALVPDTDNTTNYGVYSEFDGADPGTTYAIVSVNSSSTNSTKTGLSNTVTNEGTGTRYGINSYTLQNAGSGASSYGIRSVLDSYGGASHYGTYTDLNVYGTTISNNNFGSYTRVDVGTSTYSGTTYGDYTYMDYSSGTRYGEYKQINSHITYDGDVYGDYNRLYGSGDGVNHGVYNSLEATGTGVQYGVYNDMINTGTGANYGLYNNFPAGNTSTKYGVRNEFANENGTKYGTYNYIPNGTATGTIYGTYNAIYNDANATKYGSYTTISGGDGPLRGYYSTISPAATNTSTIYGVYSNVGSAGTGTHYGGYFYAYGDDNRAVYGSNSHSTGYAGYFYGNGYWDGDMIFNESGTSNHNLRIETDTRTHALFSDAANDVVRFGVSNGSLSGNGGSYGGATADYVADFDNGVNQGTTIGIGSIEFMIDGVARTLINNDFTPTTYISDDLGTNTTTEAWDDVYADNYVNVSDMRVKDDVAQLEYGLSEIMQMETVSYVIENDPFQERKIGVSAQNLLPLVPEAVKTHDYKILDESAAEYERVELERMGVTYNSLIPVLIKGMQEQQELIEQLQQQIKELESN